MRLCASKSRAYSKIFYEIEPLSLIFVAGPPPGVRWYTRKLASVEPVESGIPSDFTLSQNYPNPFNPTTVIKYQVPSPAAVEVAVYNVLGERVATLVNEMQAAGYYTIEWNGRDSRNTPVATGMYIYTMKAGDFSAVKKMMLVK